MTTQEKIDALKILYQLLNSSSINRPNVIMAIDSIVSNFSNDQYKAKLNIEGVDANGESVKIQLGK